MKLFTAATTVLFCLNLEFVLLDCMVIVPGASTTNTTPSFQKNWLDDSSSVQDVLTSGFSVDTSEKIQEKIINTVAQYASDCSTHKKILVDLSTEDFQFPKNQLKVDLDLEEQKVIFGDIRISESSPATRKSYSTLIECQNTRMAKIEVKLQDLEISADLRVIKNTNLTSGFRRKIEKFHEGSVSLILKDNSIISKQFPTLANDEGSTGWKIFYSKSVVSLDAVAKFQIPIYNKLKTLFDEVELSLKQFLIEKLNAGFAKNNISLTDICSIMNPDENLKKINLPFNNNNNQSNLYLIPNLYDYGLYAGYFHGVGPILINGISSFNNTGLIVSAASDPNIKDITVKIKTNDLKGKVDYRFNSDPELLSITFIIDYMEFQVTKINPFQYENKSGYNKYNKPDEQRNNKVDFNIDIDFGEMEINIPNVGVFKNNSHDNKVLMFTHAEHVKSVIQMSLTKSLEKNLRDKSLLVNCP